MDPGIPTEMCPSRFLFSPQRDAKIASSEHMRAGGSEEVAWLQICEPTEKDKGKYTFEIFDGKENHQRSLDLSGAGEPALCRPQGPRSVTELECGGRGGRI